MLTRSKDYNSNYAAKVISVAKVIELEGKDKVAQVDVDFQSVLVSKETKAGDTMVYFPVGCIVDVGLISYINAFRHEELNTDKTKKGYFGDRPIVKAIRMFQGSFKSMGFLLEAKTVQDYYKTDRPLRDYIGEEFDEINGKQICKKYIVPIRNSYARGQKQSVKKSRLVDGQVRLHVDTENLRKNINKINPSTTVFKISFSQVEASYGFLPLRRASVPSKSHITTFGFSFNHTKVWENGR